MKLLWLNRLLLTALSFMTALVKLFRMEEEMALFRDAGVGEGGTLAFGVVQLIGALLLLPARSTRVGAWCMALTFGLATGVLFVADRTTFGVASLLFIAMAILHALRWPVRARRR